MEFQRSGGTCLSDPVIECSRFIHFLQVISTLLFVLMYRRKRLCSEFSYVDGAKESVSYHLDARDNPIQILLGM